MKIKSVLIPSPWTFSGFAYKYMGVLLPVATAFTGRILHGYVKIKVRATSPVKKFFCWICEVASIFCCCCMQYYERHVCAYYLVTGI